MKVLFLFTKKFPYSTAETYLVDELTHLSQMFEKVILVPCENFEKMDKYERVLPVNVSVFNINANELPQDNLFSNKLFLRTLIWQFLHSHSKAFFRKNIRTTLGILKHQFATASRLLHEVKKYKGDTLYFYTYWIHHSALMLGLLKDTGVIKDFISRGHSLDLYNDKWKCGSEVKLIPFHEYHFKSASLIAPISKAGAEFIYKEYPQYKNKTHYYYLGVKDQGDNPLSERAEFTIVTCGRFDKNKRIIRMPEILANLTFPVKWVHFGSAGDQDKLIRNAAAQLPNNIKYEIIDYMPNAEIRSFYATNTVNLFMNISLAEGIPVSMMEAISFGIPVMATAVYGNPEIANENTGFSIPVNFDSKEIATLIEQFATSKEFQETKRKSAKNYFKKYFNSDVNFPEFIHEIQKYPNQIN